MWDLTFISEKNFKEHVQKTIEKYDEKLKSYDLPFFNRNIIDPIKMIFDKMVYRASWEEIISNEIFRQRDKSNNNDIGYFHQQIFQYIKNCEVPKEGWDVIYADSKGIPVTHQDRVQRVYVEMKNKHNTMNSSSAGKIFMQMQSQILSDDNCACFLVEVISAQSQNTKWEPSVGGKKLGHKFIRRVSLDQFYALVTGEAHAFYQVCQKLPVIIKDVVSSLDETKVPKDTVIHELRKQAKTTGVSSEDMAMSMAVYLLGFSSYEGFKPHS